MYSESALNGFNATHNLRSELAKDSFKPDCTKEKITLCKH